MLDMGGDLGNSDYFVQGGGKCADHEAELFQGDGIESVPSRYTVLKEGAGLEGQ